MKFYLKEVPPLGRLVLDRMEPVKGENLIQTIEAPSWLEARKKLPSDFYRRKYGYGYFM